MGKTVDVECRGCRDTFAAPCPKPGVTAIEKCPYCGTLNKAVAAGASKNIFAILNRRPEEDH